MKRYEIFCENQLIEEGDDLAVMIDISESLNQPAEVWAVSWDESRDGEMFSEMTEVMHVNRAWRQERDPDFAIKMPCRPNFNDDRFTTKE